MESVQTSVLKWLKDLFGPIWIAYLLMIGVIVVIATSISEAGWILNSTPLITPLIYGFILGYLLQHTRFKGWMAAFYSFLMSVIYLGQVLGRVLPPISVFLSQDLFDALAGIQIRLWALWSRVSSWIDLYRAGQANKDTGLFILLIGLLVWNGAAWMVWWINHNHNAFIALLPFAFLLAINIHLSSQGIGRLALLIVFMSLLMARSVYVFEEMGWNARQVDYPAEQGEWATATIAISIALFLIMFFSPIIGTREGWQKIADMMRKTRQQTADTASQLFADVKPSKIDHPALIATTPNLRSIGQPINNSSQVVMYVSVNDPEPPPPQVREITNQKIPKHYWRNEVLAIYNGRGWDPPDLGPSTQVAIKDHTEDKNKPEGRYLLKQHFEIIAAHGVQLFSVNVPIESSTGSVIRSVVPETTQEEGYQDAILLGGISSYDVNSWASQVNGTALRTAGTTYPPAVRAIYLQLPVNLPDRVRILADRIARNGKTPFEKAVLIQDYLRETYPYDLDVPSPGLGKDAVDYFLFEAQKGFCSYYASAMAVMLRIEGIPARVVTGYATGEYDYQRKAYVVALSSAHAWVEVYFPGSGWIEFEPTPARSAFDYPESNLPKPENKSPDQQPPQPLDRFERVALMIGGILFAGLLSFFFPKVWNSAQKEWQFRRTHDRSQILYWQMRRSLVQTGFALPPSSTPDEFLEWCTRSLSGNGKIIEAVKEVTAVYIRSIFSQRPPTDHEYKAARSAWKSAFQERLSLWFQAFISKFNLRRPQRE